MSQNMTHSENIITFDYVACHLDLEAKCLEAAKPNSSMHMTNTSSHNVSRPKYRYPNYALE